MELLQEIQQFHQLNSKQITEVENLVQACLAADGLERTLYLSNSLNYYENMDCFFLLYHNEQLVSVLAIFEPLENEAEISAYTLPQERKKGFFTALLDYAEDELAGFGIERILFVVEPSSTSGIAVLKPLGAYYNKSEYLLILDSMALNKSTEERYDNSTLELRELSTLNIERAAEISSELFGTEKNEDMSLLQGALQSDQMKTYCTFLSNDMVGVCNVNYGGSTACIFGFGIAKKYQGKGLGRFQLQLLLKIIWEKGYHKITLEVGSDNEIAFSLYKKMGFQIKTQYDYYGYLLEFEE